MNPKRRQILQQITGGALLIALGPQEIAWGAKLLGVRVWPAEDYTRITLESDETLKISHQLLSKPEQIGRAHV